MYPSNSYFELWLFKSNKQLFLSPKVARKGQIDLAQELLMDVILLQRVEKLGKLGEIVKVRPGYARNFLLPQKIALRATKENIEHFEKEKEVLEKLNLKHRDEAQVLAKSLDNLMVTLIRQASEAGHLYGSVTAKDIAEAVKKDQVGKSHVKIGHPIKTIGIHDVKLQLHPEVTALIKINIAMSEDEAKAQANTYENISVEGEVEKEIQEAKAPQVKKEAKSKDSKSKKEKSEDPTSEDSKSKETKKPKESKE